MCAGLWQSQRGGEGGRSWLAVGESRDSAQTQRPRLPRGHRFLGDISRLPGLAPLPAPTSKSPRAQTRNVTLLEGSENKEFPLLFFLPLRSKEEARQGLSSSAWMGNPQAFCVFSGGGQMGEKPENLRGFRSGHLRLLGPRAAGLPASLEESPVAQAGLELCVAEPLLPSQDCWDGRCHSQAWFLGTGG